MDGRLVDRCTGWFSGRAFMGGRLSSGRIERVFDFAAAELNNSVVERLFRCFRKSFRRNELGQSFSFGTRFALSISARRSRPVHGGRRERRERERYVPWLD
jgi:hypothetical protein